MSRIHAGLKTATFKRPNGVISKTICSETGKVARTGCKNTYTEYFLWLTVPGLCDKHSGEELKSTTNNVNDNENEVIKNITHDIDAEDPQETQRNANVTTITQTNTTENSNTTQNNNTTNTTNTNQNSSTSTNTSNTYNNVTNNTNTSNNNAQNTDNTSTSNNNINSNSNTNTSNSINANTNIVETNKEI